MHDSQNAKSGSLACVSTAKVRIIVEPSTRKAEVFEAKSSDLTVRVLAALVA